MIQGFRIPEALKRRFAGWAGRFATCELTVINARVTCLSEENPRQRAHVRKVVPGVSQPLHEAGEITELKYLSGVDSPPVVNTGAPEVASALLVRGCLFLRPPRVAWRGSSAWVPPGVRSEQCVACPLEDWASYDVISDVVRL